MSVAEWMRRYARVFSLAMANEWDGAESRVLRSGMTLAAWDRFTVAVK